MEAAHSVPSSLGRITISSDAVAQLVGHTAAECYGVVGTAGRGRVGKLLTRDNLTHFPVLGRALLHRGRSRAGPGESPAAKRPVREADQGRGYGGTGRFARDVTQGISVRGGAEGLQIELNVIVEYGLNLAEVAATLRSRVTYEVERLTGLQVAAVEVHIQDVRRSA